MKRQDVELLRLDLANKIPYMQMSKDVKWLRAFIFYNERNTPVGLNCAPCYMKVYLFCKENIID